MRPAGGLAAVLRRHGADYLATHALSVVQAKAWRAILACRTPALGGHLATCDICGTTRPVHHSCRNRHCPQCQTRAKEAWLAQRRRELLPVPYFHLVFTLPHALHGLIGAAPRALYEMLFGVVAATLTTFAANPRWLGGMPAFSLVLHTWKQDLERHVHVHALMAGGALTGSGEWVSAKRGFLFPVQALSRVFRGKFVAALAAARASGPLAAATADTRVWRALLDRLHAHDWVVYAKAPLGGPAQVLEYLGRYTHRVAISNERIVAIDDAGVHFRVRAEGATGKRRTVYLAGTEFIRRFLLHVLPKGFKRIRHYGILGPAGKATHLARARAALAVPPPDPAVVDAVADFLARVDRLDWLCCPHCRVGTMVVTAALPPLPAARPRPRGPP